MTSTSSKGQTRAAVRKVSRAIRRGWRPGRGPVCSFGQKRRARRQQQEGGAN